MSVKEAEVLWVLMGEGSPLLCGQTAARRAESTIESTASRLPEMRALRLVTLMTSRFAPVRVADLLYYYVNSRTRLTHVFRVMTQGSCPSGGR